MLNLNLKNVIVSSVNNCSDTTAERVTPKIKQNYMHQGSRILKVT